MDLDVLSLHNIKVLAQVINLSIIFQGKFFAQKQLLKEKVSDAEIDLEKRIMKNIKSNFIVELIHALSDR